MVNEATERNNQAQSVQKDTLTVKFQKLIL